ncbi:SRPBCC family protein [soil metagenome]
MTDDKKITVTRTIDASTSKVWDVLSNPEHHAQLDGSGLVQSDDHTDRITANGQTFRMNMSGEQMGGDYQTDNHVTGYDEHKLLAWQTASVGATPLGWEWMWELKANGSDSTDVSLTYDWSKVTDAEFLQKVSFPLVPESALEDSLGNLASAVSG